MIGITTVLVLTKPSAGTLRGVRQNHFVKDTVVNPLTRILGKLIYVCYDRFGLLLIKGFFLPKGSVTDLLIVPRRSFWIAKSRTLSRSIVEESNPLRANLNKSTNLEHYLPKKETTNFTNYHELKKPVKAGVLFKLV